MTKTEKKYLDIMIEENLNSFTESLNKISETIETLRNLLKEKEPWKNSKMI